MERIRGPRDKHPSGRPIRRDNKRSYGDGYQNRDEPATQRLRKKEGGLNAVGFVANLTVDDFFED
jgi:hypothetical protein